MKVLTIFYLVLSLTTQITYGDVSNNDNKKSEYRKQYTALVTKWVNENNPAKRKEIKEKIEQLKNKNLTHTK